MTLRSKTILLVSAALVALLAMIYVSSRAVLLRSFAGLEEDATRRDLQRAVNALECRIEELDITTYDWASWDDTYQFMQDRNPAYVEANLLDDTLVALGLNALLLVAPSGEVVFDKAVDLQEEAQVPVPQSLFGHLTADGLLSAIQQPGSHIRGILELPEGLVLVSSRPILSSEDEGPLRGWLIMARYLDLIEVQRLAHVTDSVLTIQPARNATQPVQVETVQSALAETPSFTVVRPLSDDIVAGYTVLPDIYGEPGVLVGVELPREIYGQGQAAVAYVLTAILLVGLAFGALQCVMLDRQVLARIMELSTGIARIGSHEDLSTRVDAKGQDELSRLGAQINDMLERLQRTQADLKRSEERYRELVESANEIIYTHDLRGNLISANPAALKAYGYASDQISYLNVADLVDPDFLSLAQQKIRDMPSNPSETTPYEILTYTKSGRPIWLEVGTRIVQPQDGGPEVQSIARDITQRREAQQALRKEKEKLDIVLETFPLGVAIISKDGRYEYMNAKFVEMFGYTQQEIPTGRAWFEKAYPEEAYRRQVISAWKRDLRDSRPGEARPRTFTVRCKDGSDKVIHFRPVSLRDAEQFLVCEDITERQQAEEMIKHMAYHDPLTGLPNRLLFDDRLQAALARARRTGEKLAVMVLDLDDFKEVNDALGHTVGDRLLQAVGERLTALLRETDTICRMGGDEFLILLTGIGAPENAVKTAHKVLEAIRNPFHLDGRELGITTSLGVAVYPDDAQDMDMLIRRTDLAMYLAKKMGRDKYQRFRPSRP
jgi:diguanylate cyclase (GGDEF)-like protein/PAS domain S-box-containing protein